LDGGGGIAQQAFAELDEYRGIDLAVVHHESQFALG
jgi:hypothetical protein